MTPRLDAIRRAPHGRGTGHRGGHRPPARRRGGGRPRHRPGRRPRRAHGGRDTRGGRHRRGPGLRRGRPGGGRGGGGPRGRRLRQARRPGQQRLRRPRGRPALRGRGGRSLGPQTSTSRSAARTAAPAPHCRTWWPPAGAPIVNIGSVNGEQDFGGHAYSAAKAGLASLTRTLAGHAGPRGVRVNLVAPGTIRTDAWAGREAELERAAALYPLGRVGEPDDIASAVAFLASPDAAWITGTTLRVDGGLLAVNTAFRAAMDGDRETR